jgi:hypothetical protein
MPNITKEEKQLVLTGMNYENGPTLYDEAKRSLKKFYGEEGHMKSELNQSISKTAIYSFIV